LGPLRAGCPGNNLKDRSAGLVVRYNWIEGGNRQLDLVDAEDSSSLRNSPSYRATHVYGNVLLEPNADGNKQIVHYGGDSGNLVNYRKGTLHFYNNTVVSRRPDQTTLFRLSTNDEFADVRNNIFYVTNSGNSLALSDSVGQFHLAHNWLKPNWRNSFSTFSGSLTNGGSNVQTSAPGFRDEANNDFRLLKTSVCVNAGGALPAALLPAHAITAQYVRHQSSEPRNQDGPLDLGAFEFNTPLQQWRHEMFGTNASVASISGNNADPDGDGMINLLEFAFQQDPLAPASTGSPQMKTVVTNGVTIPALQFTKRPAPHGLVYLVQTSSNLVHWMDGCRYSDVTTVLNAGNTIDISPVDATNRIIHLNTPASENVFLRVLISEDPS
ncbi:MAG: hypothetical protein ACK4UN_11230, partial [Limisphaerales bacterium]